MNHAVVAANMIQFMAFWSNADAKKSRQAITIVTSARTETNLGIVFMGILVSLKTF